MIRPTAEKVANFDFIAFVYYFDMHEIQNNLSIKTFLIMLF